MRSTHPVIRAAFWMTGAIASFSVMAIAGRELAPHHDTFEIMMYRSLVGIVIVCAVIGGTRNWHLIDLRTLPLHAVRNIAHFTGQNLWFFAVTAIPLAQVFALEFTQPIWVIVLSPLLLGERMTGTRVVSAVLGFLGVLVVTRPWAATLNIGITTAALAAVFFALTTMFTKRLTRNNSVASILFWLTVMQAVFGVIAAGYDGQIAAPRQSTLPWLVLVGLAGLLAHYCITNALAIAPASVVIPIDFVRLPTIAVLGMALYGEPISLWVFAGAILIFAGNYLNISKETRR